MRSREPGLDAFPAPTCGSRPLTSRLLNSWTCRHLSGSRSALGHLLFQSVQHPATSVISFSNPFEESRLRNPKSGLSITKYSVSASEPSAILGNDSYVAAAPLMTSMISRVMAAWRTRFKWSVRESIKSEALFVAASIAVIRAASSAACDSSRAR